MKLFKLGSCALIALASSAACTTNSPSTDVGVEELGIAHFSVSETPTATTIVGLDANNKEVARVELVHGPFALTGQFKEDYPGVSEVDGRKLDVTLDGKHALVWETAGYEPTLHLPAHPPSAGPVAALLDAPEVAALLAHWQIAFDPSKAAGDDEAAYWTGGYQDGLQSYDCSTLGPNSYTCGTARDGLVINECGGTTAATSAYRTVRALFWPYNEYVVVQICPAGSGGQTNQWVGVKSCPTDGTASASQASSCGTAGANAACKGCPGYPEIASYRARVTPDPYSGIAYCGLNSSTEVQTCASLHNYQSCNFSQSPYMLPASDPCSCACFCTTDGNPSNDYLFCF